jgi:hypothetical protein
MPKNLKPAPREPYEPDEITLSIAKNGSDQNAWEFSTLAWGGSAQPQARVP